MKAKVTTEQMRKLQLEMLQYVDEICRAQNIEYTLAGGSLLGAIRHAGYIPWDDDIDIELTRPNYERLLYALSEQLPDHLSLSYYKTEPTYLPWAKLYDNRTYYTSIISKRRPISGVFIDIFPMDVVPSAEKRFKEHLKGYLERASKLSSSAKHGLDYASASTPRFFLGSILAKFPEHLRVRGQYRRLAEELDQYMQSRSDEADGVIGLFHRRYPNAFYPKSMWQHYEDVRFERLVVRKLVDHHNYLVRHYGSDYDATTQSQAEERAWVLPLVLENAKR